PPLSGCRPKMPCPAAQCRDALLGLTSHDRTLTDTDGLLSVAVLLVAAEHGELGERAAVVVGRREVHEVAAGVVAFHAVERFLKRLPRHVRPGTAHRLRRNLGGDIALERGEGELLLAQLLLDRRL